MTLPVAVGLVLLGLGLLAGGGEALVRGAVAIARHAGVTPAVIGLTVVAVGTSLPELVVSVLAALRGQSDLAVGNVVGSNILNLTGILGVSALVAALPVQRAAIRLEWPMVVFASALTLLLASDGRIDGTDAAVMLGTITGFTWWMVGHARREFAADTTVHVPSGIGVRAAVVFVVVGVVMLVVGARFLVSGAVSLARLAGWSERVIGLTVVAIGTSTPELATSVIAARRGRTDMAISNLLGSNTFNLLGILGAAGVLHPVAVSAGLLRSDMVWMLLTAGLLLPLLATGQRVSRREGGLLVAVYLAYLILLLR